MKIAAAKKHTKYSELERRYTFVPVAVETFWFPQQRASPSYQIPEAEFQVQPVIPVKQVSCPSTSTRWPFRAPGQGSQKLTRSDPGFRTDLRAMTMMNTSHPQ